MPFNLDLGGGWSDGHSQWGETIIHGDERGGEDEQAQAWRAKDVILYQCQRPVAKVARLLLSGK